MDGLEQRISYHGQRPMASNSLGKSSSERTGIPRDSENTTHADSEHADDGSEQTNIHTTPDKESEDSSTCNEKKGTGREKKGFMWTRQNPSVSDRLHGETQSQRPEVLLQGSGSTSRTQTLKSSTCTSKPRGSNAGDPTGGFTESGTPACSTSRHSKKDSATTAYPKDARNTPHSCDETDKANHFCTATPCSNPS